MNIDTLNIHTATHYSTGPRYGEGNAAMERNVS